MNKNISIIGCGWLGFPLAKHLIRLGYHIKGSTTSKDKLTKLESEGIEAFHFSPLQFPVFRLKNVFL